MEEGPSPSPSSIILDGKITGIVFSLATGKEICISSISDCPINHASQLSNPFLGLPLEIGKCESCGTGEPGQCEGHFGYIELPIPIYHPDHVGELKRILCLFCLKCLKLKTRKVFVPVFIHVRSMLPLNCNISKITLHKFRHYMVEGYGDDHGGGIYSKNEKQTLMQSEYKDPPFPPDEVPPSTEVQKGPSGS